MAWRSVVISKSSRLSFKQRHLVIQQGDDTFEVPLDDIAILVLETLEATVTTTLLNELAQFDVALLCCDQQHLPSGLFLPFQQHSRFLKAVKTQLDTSIPFRKNCWRLVVQQKIRNQAFCLEYLERKGASHLLAFAKDVKSGDASGMEAAAARIYFQQYMPGITRLDESPINAALNYGYAIMRAAVARSIVSYGFLPAQGIHHCNELNSFNLADDFMEVLRPLVDLWVATHLQRNDDFTPKHRIALVALLHHDVLIQGERHAVLHSIDMMMSSFASACREGSATLLQLPQLLPLATHRQP